MGKRVYVAKEFKVEFGNTNAFNYKHTEFFDLLDTLGAEPNYINGDEDCPSDMFECTKEDYHDAVENLEVYIDNPDSYGTEIRSDFERSIKALGVEKNELLKLMKDYEKEACTDDGYLHFAAI